MGDEDGGVGGNCAANGEVAGFWRFAAAVAAAAAVTAAAASAIHVTGGCVDGLVTTAAAAAATLVNAEDEYEYEDDECVDDAYDADVAVCVDNNNGVVCCLFVVILMCSERRPFMEVMVVFVAEVGLVLKSLFCCDVAVAFGCTAVDDAATEYDWRLLVLLLCIAVPLLVADDLPPAVVDAGTAGGKLNT